MRVGIVTILSGERDPARVDAQMEGVADYVWLVAK